MPGARVESLDSLRQLRVGITKWSERIRGTLFDVDAELARAADWIQGTQRDHWKRQLRLRNEALREARSALIRKKEQKTALGGRFDYTEEEKAFRRAEQRVAEAERKLEAVRTWCRRLEEAKLEYKAVAQGLGNVVDLELPRATGHLDQMVVSLEAYLAGGPEPDWVISQADADDADVPEDPGS